MNYYDEIKNELINNGINRKVKNYSINKSDLNTYYNVGKMLNDAGKHYGESIIKEYIKKLFEDIKHIEENGSEYWSARELMSLLEYNKWERFSNTIDNAKIACEKSGYNIEEQFPEVGKLSKRNNGANVKIKDYKLSRYACYLIVQNADSSKGIVALVQTYFAIQTRKQELSEKEYSELTEDEKRFYQRNLTRKGNYSLNKIAGKSGVKDLARFHNSGYKGLYNGETADDIAKRKGLRY